MTAAVNTHIPVPPELGIANPYWDEIYPHVRKQRSMFDREQWVGMTVGSDGEGLKERAGFNAYMEASRLRHTLVPKYAWTVTDPWTVRFVAEHTMGRVIDPLAGTGYWGYLLRQLGINTVSTDMKPPMSDKVDNLWHPNAAQHTDVKPMDGRLAASGYGKDRTLLLSWPPYATIDGYEIIEAYPGNRIILIAEGAGGATGDQSMYDELEARWNPVAWHQPVQYLGMHDVVTVFDRLPADKEKETIEQE